MPFQSLVLWHLETMADQTANRGIMPPPLTNTLQCMYATIRLVIYIFSILLDRHLYKKFPVNCVILKSALTHKWKKINQLLHTCTMGFSSTYVEK